MTETPTVKKAELQIVATDGAKLGATVYNAADPASGAPVTIIAAGAAIPQSFYANFATALAARSRVVITFDYRGIGRSLAGPIKSDRSRMRDWGQKDIPAILTYARATYPQSPIHWVGHSYGGGFGVGLAPNNHLIDRHLGIAVPHGYWGEMGGLERYRIGFLMGLGVPLLTATAGYLPGKRTGLGEDLPKGVGLEWRSWIMNRNSMWDTLPAEALKPYGQLHAPMRFVCLTDDPWATYKAMNRMAGAFTGSSDRKVVHLGPADTNGAKVGHLGFFRNKFAASLWPYAFAWLDGEDRFAH